VKKNLVLLGMMAVGKSTLGKIVAKRLNLKFIDTDLNIERKNSMTISEIFKKKGEDFFRLQEEIEVLKTLKKNKCVIAIGGGAFMNKKVRNIILENSLSIWLDLNLKALNKRIKWNKKRPLLDEKNSSNIVKQLFNKRKDFYALADYKINCNRLTKNDIINKIMSIYEKQ